MVHQCKDYAIGELNAVSEGVKRTAFRLLLDLHIAAKARYSITEDPIDLLKISLETQYRCAGFVQAEIERYASLFARGESGDDLIDENEDQEDNEENLEEGASCESCFSEMLASDD